jgi:predicted nucleic acid-binding protein
VKCLDTPLLEALLRGRPPSKAWEGVLRGGGEVATTEVNMVELALRAREGPRSQVPRRLEALEKVRGALTVLPLDAEASRRAVGLLLHSKRGGSTRTGGDPTVEPALVAAICLVRGVSELYTDRRRKFPTSLPGLHLVRV